MIKITREELANIVIHYQHKFDNFLDFLNWGIIGTKNFIYENRVCVKLTKILLVTEQKYWTNEQYLSSEGLEICSILESVNVNASENKIQGVLCGIDI